MNTFRITLLLLVSCLSLKAMSPEYISSRKWVENHSQTNSIEDSRRIYVGRVTPKEYAAIFRWHNGIKLSEVLGQTPFNSTNVVSYVLRSNPNASTQSIKVSSSDSYSFEVKKLDVIWVYEVSGIPKW